jgi:plastocyanin
MRRVTTILAAATSGLVVFAGGLLLTGGVSGAETVPVDTKGYAYAPGDVTVAAGDTVTWTNSDSAPHTVTSTGGGPLDSPNMQKGDTWSFTFTQAGSYPYYCAVHPDMKGTVTVTAAAAPPTTAMPGHAMPTTTAPPAESPTTTAAPAAPSGSTVGAFWDHFEAAHLETSVGQQAAEALALDQYVLTHTVMVENMLAPLLGGGADGSVGAFWAHFQAGHLETSPGNQVAEALSLDQYVLTHTVLIENMLAPVVGG